MNIDTLKYEPEKRAAAYASFFDPFSFFENLQKLSKEEIKKAALKLKQNYDSDIEESILVETIHLCAHLLQGDNRISTICELANFIFKNKLELVYPNVTIAMRTFLCTMASNCSAECSFSCLRRIKTISGQSCRKKI